MLQEYVYFDWDLLASPPRVARIRFMSDAFGKCDGDACGPSSAAAASRWHLR